MNRYALFLGCTTPVKVLPYELSARWVAPRLGIEFIDLADFVCCGSNQVNLSLEAWLLLSAMNLALAEEQGLNITALCGGCTGALTEAVEELKDSKVRERINSQLSAIGLTYRGENRIAHLSRVIYEDVGLDRLKKMVVRDLSKLRVAPHYGCHYLKPKSAHGGFDEPDNPKTLHQLIAATGAIPIEYETLLFCCGGKTFPNNPDISFALIETKLENLQQRGVDCIVLQCNTCYLMYGLQQSKVAERSGKQYNLPVLLYPQLLGLALGADPVKDLGLLLNVPSVDRLLSLI